MQSAFLRTPPSILLQPRVGAVKVDKLVRGSRVPPDVDPFRQKVVFLATFIVDAVVGFDAELEDLLLGLELGFPLSEPPLEHLAEDLNFLVDPCLAGLASRCHA